MKIQQIPNFKMSKETLKKTYENRNLLLNFANDSD